MSVFVFYVERKAKKEAGQLRCCQVGLSFRFGTGRH